MSEAYKDLLAFSEAVKQIAFEMPAPNEFTPRFVMIAIEAERRCRERIGQEMGVDEDFDDGALDQDDLELWELT